MMWVQGISSLRTVSGRFQKGRWPIHALKLAKQPWSRATEAGYAGFDGFCPIVPDLVSSSAIMNLHNLQIKAIYNGKTVQNSITR